MLPLIFRNWISYTNIGVDLEDLDKRYANFKINPWDLDWEVVYVWKNQWYKVMLMLAKVLKVLTKLLPIFYALKMLTEEMPILLGILNI